MINSSLGNHLELLILLDILKIVIMYLWVLVLMFSVNDSRETKQSPTYQQLQSYSIYLNQLHT